MKTINVVAAIIKRITKYLSPKEVTESSKASGDLELTEHIASKWVEPKEINEKDFMEADKSVLDNLKNDKFKAFGALKNSTLLSLTFLILFSICSCTAKIVTENNHIEYETELQAAEEPSAAAENFNIESIYDDCVKKTFCIFTSNNNNGAGFLYKDKYVITNEHVLSESDSFTLIDINKNEYSGTIIFLDKSNDIAIIEINDYKGESVTFGDSNALLIGDEVLLIGNPRGGLPFSFSTGKCVELAEKLKNKLRTLADKLIPLDANIVSGYSGGPAFNKNGELIGINNAGYVDDLSEYEYDYLSFITPINRVKEIIETNIK